jgi:hypothetical protein
MDEILLVVEKAVIRGCTADGWLDVTEKNVADAKEKGEKVFRLVKNCSLFSNVPATLKDTYHIASEKERDEYDKFLKKAEKAKEVKEAEPVKVVKPVKSEVK